MVFVRTMDIDVVGSMGNAVVDIMDIYIVCVVGRTFNFEENSRSVMFHLPSSGTTKVC